MPEENKETSLTENLDSQDDIKNENLDNENINENEDDDLQDSNFDEDLESKTDEKEESVPLSVYMKEKNKRKALVKEVEDLKEKSYDIETRTFLDETKNELVDAGLDEEIASKLASRIAKVMGSKNEGKSKYESIYEDIADLAEEDDFFADANEYKQEIAKKIIAAKKVGQKMTPEEAYFALRGKQRLREIKNKTDKRKSIQNKDRDLNSTIKTASGNKGNINSKYNLNPEEKRTLSELQKAQPDAKWTAEKYYKLMKS